MIYLGDKPVGVAVETGMDLATVLARAVTGKFKSSIITKLGYMAFAACTGLTEIELPNLTSLNGSHNFNGCSNLERVYFPKLKTTSASCFGNVTKITRLALPKADGLANTFISGSRLEAIDIGGTGPISAGNFANSTNLTTIVLRSSSVNTLYRLNEIEGTPFGSSGTGGTLYVPQSMIASYQADQNWATILGYTNNQIAPIEGSQYENYYVDGMPVEVTA